MTRLTHMRGDTFAKFARYLDSKRKPINLTGTTLEASVKTPDGTFEQALSAAALDQSTNVGGLVLTAASTADWPVGTLVLKVSRTVSGVKSSITQRFAVTEG